MLCFVILFTSICGAYFNMLLYITYLPGDKYINGLVLGIAEASSLIPSKIALARYNDVSCYYFFNVICMISMTVICFLSSTSRLVNLFYYISIITIDANINALTYMLELRIPPQIFGSVMELMFCGGYLFNSLTVKISLFPYPWNYVGGVILLGVAMICVKILPPARPLVVANKSLLDENANREYFEEGSHKKVGDTFD